MIRMDVVFQILGVAFVVVIHVFVNLLCFLYGENMPYSCTLVGRKWNLHKKDSSDAIGSHNSKRECTQQMRAIYANELNDPKNIVFDGIINSTFGFDYQLANA